MNKAIILIFGALWASIGAAQSLDIKAKSGIIIEERTGVVLWEKDADALRYPASITKILTAMLLVEHTMPSDVIEAPADCVTVEGASLHLKPGETLSAGDLLRGILLRSANDACHALAVHVSGDDAAFADLMNARAAQAGCTRSHFVTPNGLHNDKHYVTARDMAILAREALKYPDIRKIVSGRKAVIQRSINTKDTLLISKNKWLDHDPTGDGIKTGYTKAAGATFVGSATRNGFRVITVILNSTGWEEDQRAMVNFAFRDFTRSAVYAKGAEIGVMDAPNIGAVKVSIDQDVLYAHRVDESPSLDVSFAPKTDLKTPISIGQEVGTATIGDHKGWSVQRPVFAVEAIATPKVAAFSPGWVIGALVLGGSSALMRVKSRRFAQPRERS